MAVLEPLISTSLGCVVSSAGICIVGAIWNCVWQDFENCYERYAAMRILGGTRKTSNNFVNKRAGCYGAAIFFRAKMQVGTQRQKRATMLAIIGGTGLTQFVNLDITRRQVAPINLGR